MKATMRRDDYRPVRVIGEQEYHEHLSVSEARALADQLEDAAEQAEFYVPGRARQMGVAGLRREHESRA